MADPVYYNPLDYNGGELIIVCAVFLSLTTIAVLLRCYTRFFITKFFKLDDWLMLVAQCVFILTCTFVFVGVHYGLGRHDLNLALPARIQATKYQALVTILYVINMMFIKLSIGVFLLRLAVQKRYLWTLRISMGVILVWSTAIVFYQFFQCQPVAFQWDNTIPGGKCAPGEEFVKAAYSISVMTIVSDWLYSIMPIFMIWNVKMTLQKKLTVSFVLSLGVFASVATLIRLKYLVELGEYKDQLYTSTNAMVWTIIEPGIAIVAASLVTIRPLLNALHFKGFNSSKNTSGYAQYSGREDGIHLGGNNRWANTSFVEADAQSGMKKAGKDLERSANIIGSSKISSKSSKDTASSSPPVTLTVPEKSHNYKVRDAPAGDASSEEYMLDGPRVVKTYNVTVSRGSNNQDYYGKNYP